MIRILYNPNPPTQRLFTDEDSFIHYLMSTDEGAHGIVMAERKCKQKQFSFKRVVTVTDYGAIRVHCPGGGHSEVTVAKLFEDYYVSLIQQHELPSCWDCKPHEYEKGERDE